MSCVKLRFERSLDKFPPDTRYELPPGYSLACFKQTPETPNSPGVDAWLAIVHDAFGDFCSDFNKQKFNELFSGKEQFDPFGVFFILHDECCVGTIMAWRDDLHADVGRLHYLAVREAHRGRGLAHFLIEAVAFYFASKGTKQLYLTTEDFRKHAIQLYQKHGFSREL